MAKRWRCSVCGYIHRSETVPDICPVCGFGSEKFELMAEEADEDPAPPGLSGSRRCR